MSRINESNCINDFNSKVLNFMEMIIKIGFKTNPNLKEVKLRKINFSEYTAGSLTVCSKHTIGDNWDEKKWIEYYKHCIEDEYLGYYWFEFKINENEYRITMYVKDFDEGSGNIHVLPGMIQIWIKSKCIQEDNKGISIKQNSTTKTYGNKKERSRDSYKCSGGHSYMEGDWVPVIASSTSELACCWNAATNIETIETYDSMAKDFWLKNKENISIGFEGLCPGKKAQILYGDKDSVNQLYKKKLSEGELVSGKATYILYKWINCDNNEMKALYKHVWVQDENAYFIVFDGEEHILSTASNDKGPNYLCNGEWNINYDYESV